MLPEARRDNLIVQELEQETLVYDLECHRAHCLNATAALVWRHCDGRSSVAAISSLLCQQHGLAADTEMVWQALGQLQRARLVRFGAPVPFGRRLARPTGAELAAGQTGSATTSQGSMGSQSRRRRPASGRSMNRRFAVAAMVAPLVTTILAPTVVMAASCGVKNDPCGPGLPACCPDLVCKNGKCHNH
jgi:hypothetical protein